MKSDSPLTSRVVLGLSTVSVFVFFAAWAIGKTSWMGPALTGYFLGVALAASTGRGRLKELAFTIWIVAAVVSGMSFPSWFIGIGRELVSFLKKASVIKKSCSIRKWTGCHRW